MPILREVKFLVAEQVVCEESDIHVETKLIEDLGFDSLDSLDTFELCWAIEEKFDIEISDEDVDGLVTIGDVVKCVVKCVVMKES